MRGGMLLPPFATDPASQGQRVTPGHGMTVIFLKYRIATSVNGILYNLSNLLAIFLREFLGRPLHHDTAHILGA